MLENRSYLKIPVIKSSIFIILLFSSLSFFAQTYDFRSTIIDVIHYSINLKVSDVNDEIEMKQSIKFRWLDTTNKISFDLSSLDVQGKGMVISSVKDGGKELQFIHVKDFLELENLQSNGRKEITIELLFSGIPSDGLVIGKNRFGDRTFFGDNWPNRAHEWFACIDHPSDKATVDFFVTVPAKYNVIANGSFEGKKKVSENEFSYSYSSKIELPTKVIVVGIADFTVKELGEYNRIPISSWVYPQNSEKALYDLDLAPKIMDFFAQYIGPYEFEKLANVQSTTRFGGMENAGCIFYDEFSLNGKRTSESLIAHEIAHQWFGNSATEKEWVHIWLSEGFATYFTNLYLENTYGKEVFQKQLEKDRSKVLAFYYKYPRPVIDSTYSELMDLLNANSYQKGSWFLHMLRRKLGDEVFHKCIIAYYQKYRLSNANTEDFRAVLEQESGVDLSQFFEQWLYISGHPMLKVKTKTCRKKIVFKIDQKQKNYTFSFPLTIQMQERKGDIVSRTVQIDKNVQSFEFKTNKRVKTWVLDPNVDLLFELVEKR